MGMGTAGSSPRRQLVYSPRPPCAACRLPLLLLALLAVRTALAYVPAPGAIFRHLLSGREEQRISSARVEGTLVLSGAAAAEVGGQGELQSDARVFLRCPAVAASRPAARRPASSRWCRPAAS